MSNVKRYLKKLDVKLPNEYPAPFASRYHSEIYINSDMDTKEAAYY